MNSNSNKEKNKTMTKQILLGAHMSIAGNFYKAIERGESIDCTAMQIFTKSGRSWASKKIDPEEAATFKKRLKDSPISSVITHASYLINLGSAKADIAKKSIHALTDELNRCHQLGIDYIVLHPGAHLGAGEQEGIAQVAKHLDQAIAQSEGNTKVLLETMAGQGTTLGTTFEQLKTIRNLCVEKRRVGVCLDTCHVFAAGYDLTSVAGYEKMMHEFDEILGLNLLHAIHLNDSKTPRGSKVDRHAPLGEGHIAMSVFERIVNDHRLADIPKILETPTDDEMKLYAKEIKLLRSL
jgi:deoxyribonuclease-4